VLGGSLVLLVLIGLGAWLGVTGYRAKAELTAAKDHVTLAKAALLRADSATAHNEVELAVANADAAHGNTSALPWDIAAVVPGLGQPFAAVQQISAAADDLATLVLRPAVQAGGTLSPETLRAPDGSINLGALASAQAPLQRAATAARTVSSAVRTIPSGGYLQPVETAREQLQSQTSELASLLRNTSDAATLLPSMLGADGPRNYFVAFQNNTEVRANGGLVGSFGILHTDHGRASMVQMGSDADLHNATTDAVNLGNTFAQTGYIGDSTRVWGNSNISANFPYVAQIQVALWKLQSGQQLDGAMATDPVALSYILGATGPATLSSGEAISADNVVRLTEVDSYARFPDNLKFPTSTQRKDYLQSVSRAVSQKVLAGSTGHTMTLLQALGRSAGEGRLAVWSTHPAEQAVLASTPLGQQVPDSAAPYANLILNNTSHGKLDYYLGRTLSYTAGDCSGSTRQSTVTTTLTNNAPTQGLPPYVTIGPQNPVGTNQSDVSLYATAGAQLKGVTVNGAPATVVTSTERGHPVFTARLVDMLPGAATVVTFTMVEPTALGAAAVPVQPIVLPMQVNTAVPVCAAK